ncbi:MAG: 3-phosphoshikimate 1-carboxyvinyltransferase [Longimicrobiales bacterium]|nr:3-phosphoshikimate 1-carboxyvinyltransferase [Longimicrobiales bacterium]
MTSTGVRVPGDKSLTQRALILAALAEGESRLSGLLHGGDAESTAGALRALGVDIPPLPSDGGEIRIRGVGRSGLREPRGPLDLGNSGTGTRLLLGVLAGSSVTATVTGDASLRARPMARITEPLTAMGGRLTSLDAPGRLPIRVEGRRPLEPVDWPSPVASAQVKSAILLAGLVGGAFALVTEPRRSRDHTERLLRSVGVPIVEHPVEDGWRVELRDPPDAIHPLDLRIPGDISSAAFLLAFGALGGAGPEGLVVEDVGLNPTRTAFLDVLRRMGVSLEVEVVGDAVEPVGHVRVRPGRLVGTQVGGDEIPRIIDELPLVAVLGARATGVTEVRDAAELRAKESDRIDALVRNLRRLGVAVEEHDDGLSVEGAPGRPLEGRLDSFHDHRIAMAFGLLSPLPSCEIGISDREVADVSFPGFWDVLTRTARWTGARP